MSKILNIPEDVYDYEFMIVKPNNYGSYDWVANFAFWNNYAQKIMDDNKDKGYVVCHNVRIAGKELRK